MQALLGVLFGFVLITTGTALECEVCIGTGTNCTGKLETCEAGKDTCVITVSESMIAGFQVQTVYKGCENSEVCSHRPQYMHFGNGQGVRSTVACCVGDACRTANPQVPPRLTKLNGKQCPSCYEVFSGTCDEREMVDCLGPEDDCLDMEATLTYGPMVFKVTQKGCVTKGACTNLKIGETSTAGVRTVLRHATCKPATFKPE